MQTQDIPRSCWWFYHVLSFSLDHTRSQLYPNYIHGWNPKTQVVHLLCCWLAVGHWWIAWRPWWICASLMCCLAGLVRGLRAEAVHPRARWVSMDLREVLITFFHGILVGGLEHGFYDFPYIGNNHPNRRTHIFQRGWIHKEVFHGISFKILELELFFAVSTQSYITKRQVGLLVDFKVGLEVYMAPVSRVFSDCFFWAESRWKLSPSKLQIKCLEHDIISGWRCGTWLLWLSIHWEELSHLTFIFFRGVGQPPSRFAWKSFPGWTHKDSKWCNRIEETGRPLTWHCAISFGSHSLAIPASFSTQI